MLLATPIDHIGSRKLRLAELHTLLTPYASWTTNYTYHQNDSIQSSATIGINAGVSAGRQVGNNRAVARKLQRDRLDKRVDLGSIMKSVTDSSTSTESIADTVTDGRNESSSGGVNLVVSASHTEGSSHSTSTAKGTSSSTGKAISNSLGKAVTSGVGKAVSKGASVTSGVSQAVQIGANFGGSFARSSTVTATIGTDEGITQTFNNYSIQQLRRNTLELQMKRYDLASALGMWDFCAYVLSEDHNVANNVAHTYLALTQGKESYMSQAAVNLWRGDLGEQSADAAGTVFS